MFKKVYIIGFIILVISQSCAMDSMPAGSDKRILINSDFIINSSKSDLIIKTPKSRPDLKSESSNYNDSLYYLSFFSDKYHAHITCSVKLRDLENKTTLIHFDSVVNIFVQTNYFIFSTSKYNLGKVESLEQLEFINLIKESFIDRFNKNVDCQLFIDNKRLIDSNFKI